MKPNTSLQKRSSFFFGTSFVLFSKIFLNLQYVIRLNKWFGQSEVVLLLNTENSGELDEEYSERRLINTDVTLGGKIHHVTIRPTNVFKTNMRNHFSFNHCMAVFLLPPSPRFVGIAGNIKWRIFFALHIYREPLLIYMVEDSELICCKFDR